MAASLQLGTWDLCAPSSPVRITDGINFGAPAPILSSVASSALDGSAVTGYASGNRQITLPVLIQGATQVAVVGLMNQLLRLVDQQAWSFQWTPAGGLPVVFNNYRATVTVAGSDVSRNNNTFRQLTVTFDSLPFAESPNDAVISLGGTGSAGTPTLVDGFEGTLPTAAPGSANGFTQHTGIVVTQVGSPAHSGGHSMKVVYTYVNGDGYCDMLFTKTGLSITVADTGQSVSVALRRGSGPSNCTLFVTLTLAGGGTVTGSANPVMGVGGNWGVRTVQLSAPVTAGTVITGYAVEVVVAPISGVFYLDDLTFVPSASGSSSGGGRVVTLSGVPGTGRAPTAVHLTPSAGGAATFRSFVIYTPPADDVAAVPFFSTASVNTGTAVYNGSYSVWVATSHIASAGSARTFEVDFTQTTRPATATYSPLTSAYTPSTAQASNQTIWYVGEIDLPVYPIADEADSSFGITATSTNGSDVIGGIMLFNTQGQLVMCDGEPSANIQHLFIDRPDPLVDAGPILGGNNADRTDAASMAGFCSPVRALLTTPGVSQLFVWSGEQNLTGELTFAYQWAQDADA